MRSCGERLFFLIALIAVAPVIAHGQSDSLADEAQEILAKRCYKCHGPDLQTNGLRLDKRDAALLGGISSLPAIVSGEASRSLLIRKITARDPNERMPKDGARLPEHEIEVLRAWIDAGAVWPVPDFESHWSFIAPVRSAIPEVSGDSIVRNPIDAFIERKALDTGLETGSEADRYALIRRASLELLGMPPTLPVMKKFLNDSKQGAYERLVDRLLESPHYGERMARWWLDVARYADTNGYEKDRPRSIWPYRDWVIEAFNENMPFDQFAIEQLAGDLLPDRTRSQVVATGFHRNTMFNEEGGIDAAEDRFKRTVDRTNTTGTAFLGLTVSCGQCHSHKHDPISQKEYYGLFSFFNDSQEETLILADSDVAENRNIIKDDVLNLEDAMVREGREIAESRGAYQVWRDETMSKSVSWEVVRPGAMYSERGADLIQLQDDSILVYGDVPNVDVTVLEFDAPAESITALRLEVLPDMTLPGGGPGRGTILAEGDFLLSGLAVELVTADGGGEPEEVVVASGTHSYAAEGRDATQALDGRADTGWSVKGATGLAHQAVFAFERPIDAKEKRIRLTLRQEYIHQHTLGRFRVSFTSDEGPIVAAGVPSDVEASLLGGSSEEDADVVERHYYIEVAPALEEARERRNKLRKTTPSFQTTLVMSERLTPRVTRRHIRGEFDRLGREVKFGVPAILPPLPDDAPRNRLTLARWIVDRGNPLTARVTMNRLWQQVFGRGLVTTPEDFGLEGEAPSHPELLDWLAVEFMESGWDIKAMHRLMVTSAAFRRSSQITQEKLERDPENALLARGPRYRLDAEAVRDSALVASGLLNRRIGGRSVRPPQPSGVTELAYGSPKWTASKGRNRYRRGLYTYLKRTAPYSSAVTFDMATSEETCMRRRRTNTPLQALTLLNDPSYREMTQSVAQRVIGHDGDLEDKIDHLYMLCLSRPADESEKGQVAEFYESSLERLQGDRERAWDIAGSIGFFEGERIIELAAWNTVCRVIMNLDEAITQG